MGLAASGLDNRGAHWSFYRRTTDAGAANGDLETLTAGDERAAFGPGPIPERDAEDALAAAEALLR